MSIEHQPGPGRAFDLITMSDEVLMTIVKEGHSEALAILFARYRCLVLHVAWRILHDVGEAEDLVQSVFLEILGSAHRYDAAKGSAKSWILQYAYNRSFNRKEYLALRGIANRSDASIATQELPDTRRCGSFETFESQRLVQEALGKLNHNQRRIFELAFYEGLSMRETAQRIGESFDSVRHQYYRAIGALRGVMLVARPQASDAPALAAPARAKYPAAKPGHRRRQASRGESFRGTAVAAS
jgi:RNA polymerase sigma-70 factor (ECF subfamily)